MRAGVLALIFVVCLAMVFGVVGRTTRGWQVTAFGEGTGNRPDEDAYFQAGRAALDQWLLGRGYAPAVSVPTPTAGMHSSVESSVAYRSSPAAPEPVTVLVTLSEKTASGLSAHVVWEYSGFTWTADRHEALAKEAIPPISAWWKDYKEKHPRR